MIQQCIFIETTIQADRLFGTPDTKKSLETNLIDKNIASSKVVLGEFINTFLHDSVLLYNLVADAKTIEIALKRLPSYQDRITKRFITISASIAEEWGWNKDYFLDGLERWIEFELIYRFKRTITLLEGIDCSKVDAKPLKENTSYKIPIPGLSCDKKNPPNCNIMQFVSRERKELLRIIEGLCKLTSLDHDQQRMVEKGSAVADGKESVFGLACQSLKDMIIALEAPKACAIYTRNIKHFLPICDILGKTLYKEI